MIFALGAGKLLNLDDAGEFEETIISKCIDTFIALSASNQSTQTSSNNNQQPPQLITAFPQSVNGASSTSAGLASPTTPFSQSTLPSKSLLSRQESSTADSTFRTNVKLGASNEQSENLVLQRGFQKQLQAVIEQLFERCFQEKRYRQVIGIAVEARNLDIIRRVIQRASQDEKKQNGEATRRGEELMEYVLDICMSVVQERGLRNEVCSLSPHTIGQD